jgi:hypothetical protein
MNHGQFNVAAALLASSVFPSDAYAAPYAITIRPMLPLMTRFAFALALLLCSAPAMADILMGYRLEAEGLNGNPISTIAVGQNFQLAVFAHDLRNPTAVHAGVFAGFLNVAYDPLATIPAGTTTVNHNPLMIHGTSQPGFFALTPAGDLSTPGHIFGGGATGTSLTAPGPSEQALWTLTMHALSAGTEHFISSFDTTSLPPPAGADSGHDTLLYGLAPLITSDQINFGSTTLAIVPEPSSIVLAAVGFLAFGAWTWRRRRA